MDTITFIQLSNSRPLNSQLLLSRKPESFERSAAKEAANIARVLVMDLTTAFAQKDTNQILTMGKETDAETTMSAPMLIHALLMYLEDSVLILILMITSIQCTNVAVTPIEDFYLAQPLILSTALCLASLEHLLTLTSAQLGNTIAILRTVFVQTSHLELSPAAVTKILN